jgi:energy-coupling factor transporter ATP-binding protein EcfA2
MKQKLALAQAFSDPVEVLILDEPTSALDPSARAEVLALVREARDVQKQTVIFSGHVLSEVEEVSDRVAIMREGRLLHLEDMLAAKQPGQILPELMQSADPEVRSFALRIENLGLLTWDMWAAGGRAATEIINDRPAATVLDLGGFATVEQPLVVALAVLDELWARRSERRPVLIVIDEAHNLCRPEVETPLQRLVLERIIQIAAEGRKYGLWLLLSTQRPSKIHAGIISQCDNLALMRMSSERDLDELAATLSFAPPALLAKSPSFRQGEALFAGGFVPAPTTVVMRSRLTAEGGRDVAVPLRS